MKHKRTKNDSKNYVTHGEKTNCNKTGNLYKVFNNFYLKCRNDVYKDWKRVLPLGDYVVDRWEKARFLKFGKGSSIYDSSLVFGDVKVGEHTWIGPFVILDGSGGLEIGSYCSISSGVQIYTHDSVEWALSKGRKKYSYAPVSIGDCCYIGPNVIISKGVTIGNYCVIGACSFVNKNIPDFSVSFGIPCKIRGKIKVLKNGKIKYLRANR